MKTAQQVWEEAYPDRRKWEALDQDTRDEWERVVMVAQDTGDAPLKLGDLVEIDDINLPLWGMPVTGRAHTLWDDGTVSVAIGETIISYDPSRLTRKEEPQNKTP